MKSIWTLALFLVIASGYSARAADTLRYYNVRSKLVYFRDPTITAQATRFDAVRPLDIVSLTVSLGGRMAGSARLHIYNAEGGLAVPRLERDLIAPIVVHKSGPGFERITLTLPRKVHIDGSQFFIVIDSLSPGLTLLSDNQRKLPSCSNESEEFQHQFLRLLDGQWRSGVYAFAIDAVVEYTAKSSQDGFRDVTAEAGIDDSLRNNQSIAWADIDGDDRLDLLLDGRLYHNNVDGTFSDISAASGISGTPRANAFIDIDNDGRPDILFIGSHDSTGSRSLLFRNNGDRTFSRSTLQIPSIANPTSFSIADATGDGYLDLFIGQQSKSPGDTLHNYLLINNRQSGFVDRSFMLSTDSSRVAQSRGSEWIDYDNDGHPDLFIASYTGRDELWKNVGDSSFTTVSIHGDTTSSGRHSAGGDWGDYDNDGDVDLLLPQMIAPKAMKEGGKETGVLILNNSGAPDHLIEEKGANTGIDYVDEHSGGTWGDYDNDGLADAIITTGCDCRYASLYRQTADRRFEERTTESGLRTVMAGPDAVWVDYDNDGRLDLATISRGRFRLYRNAGGSANQNRYMELDLSGQSIGATVTLYTGSGKLTSQVVSGRGILMQPPLRLHFGLADAKSVDSVVVQYHDNVRTFTNLQVNSIQKLSVGDASSKEQADDIELHVSPNPFTTSVQFSYVLPTGMDVGLDIYAIDGRKLVTLIHEKESGGPHQVAWNGTDNLGEKLSQGEYIYRYTANTTSKAGSIILTR